MENVSRGPDPAEARDALASIRDVQRAVRDTPWPTWLYPVNAVLLGALALTPVLHEHRSSVLLAVALTVMGVNGTAGYRMGTPWALPTSRGFLAAVVASVSCVVAAFAVTDLTERTWPVVVLAIATTAIYLAGGVIHRRSTGRPR
jgi:Kef-type K+ transport system membrane component KefB